MSNYKGFYIKTQLDPQFWYINEAGQRIGLHHPSELSIYGWPLPLEHVTDEELQSYPIADEHTDEPEPPVMIYLADGVDDTEATIAAKALRARRKGSP